jgi:hypothetical protein
MSIQKLNCYEICDKTKNFSAFHRAIISGVDKIRRKKGLTDFGMECKEWGDKDRKKLKSRQKAMFCIEFETKG